MLSTVMLKYKLVKFKGLICIQLRITDMFALLIGWPSYYNTVRGFVFNFPPIPVGGAVWNYTILFGEEVANLLMDALHVYFQQISFHIVLIHYLQTIYHVNMNWIANHTIEYHLYLVPVLLIHTVWNFQHLHTDDRHLVNQYKRKDFFYPIRGICLYMHGGGHLCPLHSQLSSSVTS